MATKKKTEEKEIESKNDAQARYESLIEAYKAKNPEKYEAKKASFEARLKELAANE